MHIRQGAAPANSGWKPGDGDIIWTVEGASIVDFIGLWVDGVELVKDVDYKIETGSIRIIIFESFLRILNTGTVYEFTAELTSGPVIFEVRIAYPSMTVAPVDVPRTGINNNVLLWVLVLIISTLLISTCLVLLNRQKDK